MIYGTAVAILVTFYSNCIGFVTKESTNLIGRKSYDTYLVCIVAGKPMEAPIPVTFSASQLRSMTKEQADLWFYESTIPTK